MPVSVYRIYKCQNKVTDKVYIGFTNKALNKRINEHYCSARSGSDYILHKAIRKYGEESFEWTVLFESTDKEYTLTVMEPSFIKEYNCFYENGFGYNMTYGGQGGMSGKKHSQQTKLKMKMARNKSKYQVRNPKGIGLDKAIIKAAQLRKGTRGFNLGKKFPQLSGQNNIGGNMTRGKTWVKDPISGKRVWI